MSYERQLIFLKDLLKAKMGRRHSVSEPMEFQSELKALGVRELSHVRYADFIEEIMDGIPHLLPQTYDMANVMVN